MKMFRAKFLSFVREMITANKRSLGFAMGSILSILLCGVVGFVREEFGIC
jgi:hypothetical protein